MVQKDSLVESLTFSGMGGIYSANHATKALQSLFPFLLGFIPYEIPWKIYVGDTPSGRKSLVSKKPSRQCGMFFGVYDILEISMI